MASLMPPQPPLGVKILGATVLHRCQSWVPSQMNSAVTSQGVTLGK